MDASLLPTILTIANLAILLYQAMAARSRVKPQNLTDDSAAATRYRDLVISLESEVQDLKHLVDKSYLNVRMSVHLGEPPLITKWEWMRHDRGNEKPLL